MHYASLLVAPDTPMLELATRALQGEKKGRDGRPFSRAGRTVFRVLTTLDTFHKLVWAYSHVQKEGT